MPPVYEVNKTMELKTATDLVRYLFPKKTIVGKIVQSDRIIFAVKRSMPIYAHYAVGHHGERGVRVERRDYNGECKYSKFVAGIELA